MRTIRIDRHRVGERALAEAVRVLRDGGVVAYPTETAYGLAGDPADRRAVRRIYRMKGRAAGKALPLICADRAMVSRLVMLPRVLARAAAAHWPGPLTIVATLRAAQRGRIAGAKDGSVALRVPSLAWPRALSRRFGRPITATSANRSGRPPLYSGAAVRAEFAGASDAPDLVLDAGTVPVRAPSTIVAAKHGKMKVVRQGQIVLAGPDGRRGE